MSIQELRDVDGLKRWDLLYEDVELVLLSDRAPLPWRSELLAFDSMTCRLLWKLTPKEGVEKDYITGVWIRDGKLRAASWSCFTYTLDRRTGDVLDCVFTK
jgi:hypothetical protein